MDGLIVTNALPKELRPYQEDGISRLRGSLRSGKRRPLLQAPTGAGKTLVAAALIRMAQEKNKRVIFCVPALSLIDQTIESFYSEGLHGIGVIQSNHTLTNLSQPIQVASVQTLMRRWPMAPEAQLVIIDEAHRMFEFYGKWMCSPDWSTVPFVGLSATPWSKGLGRLYDDLIVLTTTAELIEAGYLSRFRVFAPAHPDLSKVRTVAGDYHEGELAEAMNTSPLVADVVETWLKYAKGLPTLCFAVDRAHAKHLQQRFEAAGVPCGYQDMNTQSSERREIRQKFHNGEYQVVTNCETLTTGVDWDVRCIVIARPTKSEMLHVQILGRGLRTANGKDDLIILDHSDNHLRLGFVTDIHHETLDDGRSKPKQKGSISLPKECPQCSYLRPPRVAKCPNCGHESAPQIAETAKGELAELTPGKKKKDPECLQGKTKAIVFGELKSYASVHGRKPGWAAHVYRELYGVWPNAHRDVPEIPTSFVMLNWIKHRNIAWAKAHAR